MHKSKIKRGNNTECTLYVDKGILQSRHAILCPVLMPYLPGYTPVVANELNEGCTTVE
jgi:hypothetical protein